MTIKILAFWSYQFNCSLPSLVLNLVKYLFGSVMDEKLSFSVMVFPNGSLGTSNIALKVQKRIAGSEAPCKWIIPLLALKGRKEFFS